MKKKRLILIWFILAAALALSGCSLTDNMVMRLNGWMSNQLMEKSGVTEDESYVQAQNNGEAGLLDEDGKLTEKVDVSEDEIGIGPIHVTFAQNRNININYFRDQQLTQKIEYGEFFLNPGDSLYYSDVEANSDQSDHYVFSGFRFIEYDLEGNRLGETDYISDSNGVISIPYDYTGSELSIEPIGYFESRAISLKAYWIDEKGNEIVIDDVVWKINNEEYSETETEINPGIAYTVTLEYDPDTYFYEDASSELFTNDEQNGFIQFKEVEAVNGIGSFRVRLHPYTSLAFDNTDKKIVSVLATGKENIDVSSKNFSVEKLKPGDSVSIVLDSEYKLISDQKELIPYSSPDSTKYDFKISKSDHGVCEIKATKWSTKTIPVSVTENGFWEKLKNNYFSWLPFLNKEEINDVLTITSGNNEYTYSDLINGKNDIKMSEKDTLIINVDKEKVDGFSFIITINNMNPISVNSNSDRLSFTFSYYEISEIAIELVEE